ncbi:MAG: hypothetical protein ABGZ17_00320 [Planctomycetaceae bacterium]
MYSILFSGDASVHIDGSTTEIVGHGHIEKDRPETVFFSFGDQPQSTARVDVERNRQGRFIVTCHPMASMKEALIPAGLSDCWDKHVDDPIACFVISNHCDEEIYFLTIEGLEERILCGDRFVFLFFDERPNASAEVSLCAETGSIDVCTSTPYWGILNRQLSFEM